MKKLHNEDTFDRSVSEKIVSIYDDGCDWGLEAYDGTLMEYDDQSVEFYNDTILSRVTFLQDMLDAYTDAYDDSTDSRAEFINETLLYLKKCIACEKNL